jgi:hypothetical protein
VRFEKSAPEMESAVFLIVESPEKCVNGNCIVERNGVQEEFTIGIGDLDD